MRGKQENSIFRAYLVYEKHLLKEMSQIIPVQKGASRADLFASFCSRI